MELEQELEWAEAQNIAISVDIVAAAKQQLKFLAAVDRKRELYGGPALERAIYRYNACWLPLLAKYSESQLTKGPLVVPLDCEWVWHCHRLNPVRYKADCEKFYGKVLDNCNVVSSIQESSTKESETIWNELFPNEPYEFDFSGAFSKKVPGEGNYTKYDLISAVKRQSPFFYQVSRVHVSNDLFLESAAARYKGFLHLIKRNNDKFLKRFCVPTYDVDLMWHTHQLHPSSYSKDLVSLLGKVLEHDDTDSDRSKGMKLDTGFFDTTKQWEDTFGSRYWRAGAMYRGTAPSPVTFVPHHSNDVTKQADALDGIMETISLPEIKIVEVMLEFVSVRNISEGQKGSLSVIFSKTQPDAVFNIKKRLNISSESREKQVACFHCEPKGKLIFELVSQSSPNLKILNPPTTLGSTSISLDDYLSPVSNLSVERWLDLGPGSGSKPISLRVAMSFNVPTVAPHVMHMVPSKGSCFFSLPKRVQFSKNWTRVVDEAGDEVMSLQMREVKMGKGKDNKTKTKEVICVANSGETRSIAELVGAEWSFKDSQWSLKLEKSSNKDGHIFEFTGERSVKLFPGKKLEYETKQCEKHKSEKEAITVVEFSTEDPYGRAVALLDLKSGFFMVKEDWLVLPAIILNFILSDVLKTEGYRSLIYGGEHLKEIKDQEADVSHNEEAKKTNLTSALKTEAVSIDMSHYTSSPFPLTLRRISGAGHVILNFFFDLNPIYFYFYWNWQCNLVVTAIIRKFILNP